MRTTIAIVGPIASGKGTIAEMLIKKGYRHFTYGEEVKKEIDRRGLPLERAVYQDVSDSLRAEFGSTVLAQRMAGSINEMRANGDAEKALIDGLRHPDEVQWLKDNFDTKVIGIVAPLEARYERVRCRGRSSDPATREGFDEAEQRDRGVGQPEYGNRVDDCLPLADITIINDGTVKDLQKKLREALISLGIEGARRSKEGR